jgi:hypothetical protein
MTVPCLTRQVHWLVGEVTHQATMNDEELRTLAERFDFDNDNFSVDRIPEAIADAMVYIADNTGLLGDYNDGVVRLVEGGEKIQWYARGRYFSQHDNLIHWVQMEHHGLLLGTVGIRPAPGPGEGDMMPYAEIHPTYLWGYDDDLSLEDAGRYTNVFIEGYMVASFDTELHELAIYERDGDEAVFVLGGTNE